MQTQCADTSTDLKMAGNADPQPMPLVDVKVPRLFAAMWSEWRSSKYFSDDVAGAAILAFLSLPQAEQLGWINQMQELVRKTYDAVPPTEGSKLMQDATEEESEIWLDFINRMRIGLDAPFDPTT